MEGAASELLVGWFAAQKGAYISLRERKCAWKRGGKQLVYFSFSVNKIYRNTGGSKRGDEGFRIQTWSDRTRVDLD